MVPHWLHHPIAVSSLRLCLFHFLLFHPSIFLFIVSWRILTKGQSAQHGSEWNANHHQQLHEVDKNYRMLFSKGVTEIEYVTTIRRLRPDQHLKGMKPQLLGLCLWSKVAIILGRLTPVSSLKTGSSLFVRWKNEILPFPKEVVTKNTFTQQSIFFLTSWAWRLC